MTRIDLVYFNAGGGHRAAALALQAACLEQQRPWSVELVDLFDVLDPTGQFARMTGVAPEAYYNMRLAKGWTLGLQQELKVLQGIIRLGHARLVARLRQHWLQSRPDLVVSVIPNFNRALCEGLQAALPGVPFVTVMTDLADHPPHFWIEPDPHQHVVCGTAKAVEQARALGCEANRIFRTSGMVLRPDLYRPLDGDRRAALAAMGFDPDRPVALVSFGGHGSLQMLVIEAQLRDVQLILLCGHNEALAKRLGHPTRHGHSRRVVVGFTPDVGRYLRMSDLMIGKPGPGSLSEALHCGLPIVTVRNAWTMPQERYNTEWLVEQGYGLVGKSMRDIRPTVMRMVDRLDAFKRQVAGYHNEAVFEVPGFVAELLARCTARDVRSARATPSRRAAIQPTEEAMP